MYSIYADFMRIATRMPDKAAPTSETRHEAERRRWEAATYWKAAHGRR